MNGSKKSAILVSITALLGVILFSAKGIFIKQIYQSELAPLQLMFLRMLLGSPLFLFTLWCSRQQFKKLANIEHIWCFLLGFLGYYLASLLDFYGLFYLSASMERILLFSYPLWVLLLQWIFCHKVPSWRVLSLVVLAYGGITLLFSRQIMVPQAGVWLGAILVIGSAISYASYLLIGQKTLSQVSSRLVTSYAMSISFVLVIVHYCVVRLWQGNNVLQDFYHLSKETYFWIGLLVLFSTVIPSFMINYALSKIGAMKMAVFGGVGPISTCIFAAMFLGEVLYFWQVIGAVIVLVSIVILQQQKVS